ncbi:E3 ubiquitin-protein ligase TRIM71-like [Branchiostoma floridae]|uniref:E3 ubiquitin-protein ligase TRIM71-like n=1 Tax=Branchiostoma floridae TaxID=7739 RepID=A0A9J7HGW3_BRAFL|nr:E3 ubiquitin-protein ligase TRIM71-like [Branchiostoma floridae]
MRQAIQNLRNAELDSNTLRGSGDVDDKLGEDPTVTEEDKGTAGQDSDTDPDGPKATEEKRHTAGAEGAASDTTGDLTQDVMTFGRKGSEPGEFHHPRGVVVSPSNDIFVADMSNKRVQVHTTEGVYLRHFPTVVPGTADKDMGPHDVCMDGNGTLWVVGEGGSAEHVVQYSTDGIAMGGFHLEEIGYFRGIAVDMRTNHILVTDAHQGAVHVFRPDGSLVRTVQHPREEMRRPRYVTVDGNFLVSDRDTHRVYVYDESGKFLFQFGGEGSGEGQMSFPHGICTDSSGHILVADYGNERVQIFTRHGEFVRTVHPGFNPEGLAVGPEGQLVVTSHFDHTVTVYPCY